LKRDGRICVAKIGAPHGVRGEVRLWTFTEDPQKVVSYGPLETEDGVRQFKIARLRATTNYLVATIDGVTSREAAQQLNGVELFVRRDRLPDPADGEFYHADLIGLAAETARGEGLGTVVALHNFGAGDIIEIAPTRGPTIMLPFSNAVVPVVDIKAGKLVIERPGEIEGEPSDHVHHASVENSDGNSSEDNNQ
jgi:16S rRNA processing protein RimM